MFSKFAIAMGTAIKVANRYGLFITLPESLSTIDLMRILLL